MIFTLSDLEPERNWVETAYLVKSNSRTAPKTAAPPPVYREELPKSGAPKADFLPIFPHQDRS